MIKHKTKSLKVCAGASAGGHMNQLLLLLDQSYVWPVQPDFYITTMPELLGKLEKRGRAYVVGECNRYRPLETVKVIFRAFRIIMKEKPDVIITTGSMPIAMLCLIGKLFRSKVIWIDSIANPEKFSLSGRLMIHFSDLFLTQWPELSKKNPKAEYVGEII